MDTTSKKIVGAITTISAIISIFAGLIAILEFIYPNKKVDSEVINSKNPVQIVKNKSLVEIINLDITDDIKNSKENNYSLLSLVIEHNIPWNIFKERNYKVIIDSTEYKNETFFNKKVSPGKHTIKVISDDDITESIEINLQKNRFYEIKVKLFPNSTGGYNMRKLHIWKNQNNSTLWKIISMVLFPLFYGIVYFWFFIANNFKDKYYINFEKFKIDEEMIKSIMFIWFGISCFLSFISWGLFDHLAMATSIRMTLILFFVAPIILSFFLFLFLLITSSAESR